MERDPGRQQERGGQRGGLSSPSGTAATTPEVVAVRSRHWGRWLAAVLLVGGASWLVLSFLRSPAIDFGVVRKFQFNHSILVGLRNTVVISLLAQVMGILLGIGLAVMRLSPNPVLRVSSWVYIWFFRGTPVLVQLVFWFSLPLVFKHLTIAVPFTHLTLYSTSMVRFMTPFKAALAGLGLNEGAYMAEIVRAGIIAVDRGQIEAAQALGMTPGLTMRRIVLPQAMRVIIPPTGNELISMLKTSSLASIVLYPELLRRAQDVYSTNLAVLELLVVASIWYLALTSVASVGQMWLERRFARGVAR